MENSKSSLWIVKMILGCTCVMCSFDFFVRALFWDIVSQAIEQRSNWLPGLIYTVTFWTIKVAFVVSLIFSFWMLRKSLNHVYLKWIFCLSFFLMSFIYRDLNSLLIQFCLQFKWSNLAIHIFSGIILFLIANIIFSRLKEEKLMDKNA
jgi:hypothetical protein